LQRTTTQLSMWDCCAICWKTPAYAARQYWTHCTLSRWRHPWILQNLNRIRP